jgi:CRISPR-associated protein Csb2
MVDGPFEQVALEMERRGLPVPVAISALPGARWLEFRRHRRGHESLGWAYGFELETPEPVQGPLALGWGCHFGLGLFLPAG